MDFLKTLLAYMSLLTALSVQEGPAQEAVPTPTPLPTHMTATPEPNQTEAPTPSPTPTLAPAPTITPNNRYSKVSYGDKGSQVTKLQKALIALGYLPSDAADGAFGYQTHNAVKAFQKANGLNVDGVAGPATLTNLYENPNAIGVATATPSIPPTATPTLETGFTAAPTDQPDGLTLLQNAYVISGSTGEMLQRVVTTEYETFTYQTTVRPQLWVNASGKPVLSLAELTNCLDGWTLMGSSADGLYALSACGYTVSIQLAADSPVILVDGQTVQVAAEDVFIQNGTLYVTDGFLHTALKAETVFDADEKSIVLTFRDKSIIDAQD